MSEVSLMPLYFVVIPGMAALLIMITGEKKPNIRETWTIIASISNVALVFYVLPRLLAGDLMQTARYSLVPNVDFFLKIDAAGMLFASLASILWVATSFYGIGYMRAEKKKNQTGFFASFAVCISAVMGISFSGNLLTFFIFYEILTIATYPLVVHSRNEESINSGRKYLAYTLISGQVFLFGIIWLYHLTGTTDFVPGGSIGTSGNPISLTIIFILLILGSAVKAGIMPFHGWLPAAMIAPTPVSALLHAVAVVKAGVFSIVRIVGFIFGFDLLNTLGIVDYLAWLAAFTIIVASIIALRQDNLKRRLAFSTIGQLSYIVLGVALANEQAFLGGLFHIAAHAFMKITLFFCAGAIFVNTGFKYISEMHGIGRKMPITMAMFGIASLGISGMPFTVGFISKWNLVMGSIAGGKIFYVIVFVASAMLSATYLFTIFVMAFYEKNDNFTEYGEVREDMLIPIIFTGIMSIILGINPNFLVKFYDLAIISAEIVSKGIGG
ncbi:MAG: monovalent cation/H+ antiporter subunit D family protein [Clostridia bacterium]|nr:monovalent cation/H+ antiporter subunit D family protein [Clostridia bacterium]